MNGRPLWAVLWHRRWTALIVLVVVAAATVGWLLIAARSYTATATFTATPQASYGASAGTVEQVQATLAELADSRAVLSDALTQIDAHRSVATLQREVHAEQVDGTALIRIDVTDGDRFVARDIANAVAYVLPKHDPTSGQFVFTGADQAVTPSRFSSPQVATAVLVGAVAAVVLAVAAALARERVAGRVDGADQVERLTGAPVLAGLARPAEVNDLPAATPTGAPAAQFRALRVGLEFASSDEPTSVVVVAPVVRDEAAAWVTVNLAGALAQVEHRVLVIDADLGATYRHPAFRSKGPGLAEVLRGTAELRDAVRPTSVSGVSLLPAGNLNGVSAAELVELRFHRALAEIDKDADLVLVHCAPLAESDDARVMAVGNGLLLAVPAGRMPAGELRRMAAELRRLRLRVLGAVLIGRRRRRGK